MFNKFKALHLFAPHGAREREFPAAAAPCVDVVHIKFMCKVKGV